MSLDDTNIPPQQPDSPPTHDELARWLGRQYADKVDAMQDAQRRAVFKQLQHLDRAYLNNDAREQLEDDMNQCWAQIETAEERIHELEGKGKEALQLVTQTAKLGLEMHIIDLLLTHGSIQYLDILRRTAKDGRVNALSPEQKREEYERYMNYLRGISRDISYVVLIDPAT